MTDITDIFGADITLGAESDDNFNDAVVTIRLATLDGPVEINLSMVMADRLGSALQHLCRDTADALKLWK
jgi:hypothetical protein